jgi:gamma-butyrobetaine dioxygenase
MAIDPRYHSESIDFDQRTRQLSIIWSDGHSSEFPYIWLRHERMFPFMGRPEQSDQKSYQLPQDPSALSVTSVQIEDDELLVQWVGDSRPTQHDLVFLRNHCLSDSARRDRRPTPKLWNAESARNFQWFDALALDDPAQRLNVYLQLRDRGIALVKNLPSEAGSLRSIAANFGPVRNTHFGDLFDIRSLPDDNSGTGQNIGATASNAQSPHTDEGWRHGPPGISIMHCLFADPSGGGASIYVDGIAAAEALRSSDPEAFEFLSTVPLTFCAERNPEERFRSRARVIATDSDNIIRGIRVTDRTIQQPDLPHGQVELAYRAMGQFYALLLGPEFRLEHLLQPGEIVAFDNHRVLHARRAFDATAGERWIQQLSIDREEFHSFFRQLAESQGRYDLSNWEQDAGALSQN